MVIDPNIKNKLALALDIDDIVAARRSADLLSDYFGVVKVGLELFSAAGPEAIETFVDAGFAVFADLKLLDIPTTVRKAATVIGSLGASYLTVHTRAGVEHLQSGVEGFSAGARNAGLPEPQCLGVTVLTSEENDPAALAQRVEFAIAAGCAGVVCSAIDLPRVNQLAPSLQKVVPGIRPAWAAANDQKQIATPTEALAAGANLLVIGRAVLAADDPRQAAEKLHSELKGSD